MHFGELQIHWLTNYFEAFLLKVIHRKNKRLREKKKKTYPEIRELFQRRRE